MAHSNKHSVEVGGHQTSLNVEPEYWDALRRMAAEQGIGVHVLVDQIWQHCPPWQSLSSAVRVHVLKHYKPQDDKP